jgi:cephalosporin hydroxylase
MSDPAAPPPPPPPPPAAQPQQTIELRAEDVVNFFHQLYYAIGIQRQGTWSSTYWMGVPTEKVPLDMWIYQELLFALRPDLIIETGTRHGGSALFYCQMMDLIGIECDVVTVDVTPPAKPPQHARLTYLTGSSVAPDIVAEVTRRAAGKKQVMVILDSDHARDHVLAELRAYNSLVTPGGYLIIEDTNVNGHPVFPEHGPGPMEALADFVRENQDFQIDRGCEKFLFTMHPNGWLRKRTPGAEGT